MPKNLTPEESLQIETTFGMALTRYDQFQLARAKYIAFERKNGKTDAEIAIAVSIDNTSGEAVKKIRSKLGIK